MKEENFDFNIEKLKLDKVELDKVKYRIYSCKNIYL